MTASNSVAYDLTCGGSTTAALSQQFGGPPDPVPVPPVPGPDPTPPVIYSLQGIDLHTVQVVFSEDVVFAEAMSISNYSLTGGLTVSAVINLAGSQRIYRITTSTQTPATNYTLTVSGVHDLAGNLI